MDFSSPAIVWRDFIKCISFASTFLKAEVDHEHPQTYCVSFQHLSVCMPFPPQSEVHILLLQLHNSLIQLHAWLAWQEPGTVVEILDTLPIVQRALLMGAVEFNS